LSGDVKSGGVSGRIGQSCIAPIGCITLPINKVQSAGEGQGPGALFGDSVLGTELYAPSAVHGSVRPWQKANRALLGVARATCGQTRASKGKCGCQDPSCPWTRTVPLDDRFCWNLDDNNSTFLGGCRVSGICRHCMVDKTAQPSYCVLYCTAGAAVWPRAVGGVVHR